MFREEAKKIVNNFSIIKAFAEGKTIQCRNRYTNSWSSTENPVFDPTFEYRVRPEPREWDMRVMPNGCLGSPVLNCPDQLIRVREVLDETLD